MSSATTPAITSALNTTRSTCPYCGVGCGVLIESEGSRITGVRGDPDHPANWGRLCTKGSTLHLTARSAVTDSQRLLHPMWRPLRSQPAERTSWEQALEESTRRLSDIWQRHGPDAIGVYVSGQLLTEDYYVFNKLVKGLLGTNHIDTNSRLCMSSAVAGYKASLGADAPPCSYEDLALADTVLIAGSNLAWAHPILFRRLEDARRARPHQKWIVIDPRRTETAEQADLHLQLQPGTDVALFHGLLHLLLWEGLTDSAFIAAHTSGFEALRDRVRECTPAATARATGCAEADIVTAARWFGAGPASLSLYCQGLNQSSSGTDKNTALINLHLATGQIGKPGAGPFSLTGQPNAMGGREVGGLANLLSAHRDLANPAHRAEVAALWGVDELPANPGRTAVEMFQAAADGEVKALWIACTNPAQSLPDQATVRRAFERAEFVLVQEAFAHTATAQRADVLLPATTWGEKDGTVTNSERRISRVRPAVQPPGQARHDWAIAADIGRGLAQRLAPHKARLLDYPTPEAIWNEHRESTRGRDLDITGLSYARLEELGPQQWPMPEGSTAGRARLYEDGVFPTPDGRARFIDAAPRRVAEPRSAAYPFSLTTGRLRDQWHGMSRTGTLGRLYGHAGEPVVELHPQDLARLRLREGDPVRLQSRRGSLVLPARASEATAPTQAFVAMHWGSEALGGFDAKGEPVAGVNALTSPAFCPSSKQPELKHAAVRVEAVSLPWRLAARAWVAPERLLVAREALMARLREPDLRALATVSVLPFGREPDAPGPDPASAGGVPVGKSPVGLVLRGGASEPLPRAAVDALLGLMGLSGEGPAAALGDGLLAYDDLQRGQQRRLRVSAHPAGGSRLSGYALVGDAAGHESLDAWLLDGYPLPMAPRLLLAPGAIRHALAQAVPRSPQVCACHDVDEARICAHLLAGRGDAAERLAALQRDLRCGTQCGSCLPKLQTLARAAAGSRPPVTNPPAGTSPAAMASSVT